MRPPRFWFNPPDRPGWEARALAPLAALTATATARRLRRPGVKASVPVICIGNLNLGGTGKTPTVIALLQRMQARGIAAHVVSRGYGGAATGPLRVDERAHKASETGDEPLLIAAFGPTWVAKDRSAGVRAAVEAGAQAVLLDDGSQNSSVITDASVIVVDAATGFGNGRVAPSGPLREPVETGLARGTCLLSIGSDADQAAFKVTWGRAIELPHVTGRLEPLQTGMDWQGLDVLAFAGIGRPEKFFSTLRDLGARLVHTISLDDHQPLTTALMQRLEADAARAGAQLVTTEKDAVRLPASFRPKVLTLPVRLIIDDWSAIDAALGL